MIAERILSVIFAALAPLPLMITASAGNNGGMDIRKFAFYAVLGIAAWLVAMLLGLLMRRVPEKMYGLVKMASIVAGVVIVALCEWLLAITGDNSVSMLFVPLAVVFCYWFGCRLFSDKELLPFGAMGAYCVEAVFAYPMCIAFEEEGNITGSTLILLLTAALTVMGAVILNIRHLEQLSYQGGGRELTLSRTTVRFNLKKTLTFSGVLLFLFLFSGFGAKWLWEAIKAFILWLLDLLQNLSTLIDLEPIDMGRPEIEIPQNENPIVRIIFYTIVSAIILVGAILLVRYIARLLTSLRKYLNTKTESRSYEASYVDIYEESERQRTKSTYSKAYRAFAREKDLTKKYRLGYKAFMLLLGRKNENTPSDTTGVHLVRGRIYDDDLAENVIGKYERLRYHEYSPTKEDCEELDRLLKAVRGTR